MVVWVTCSTLTCMARYPEPAWKMKIKTSFTYWSVDFITQMLGCPKTLSLGNFVLQHKSIGYSQQSWEGGVSCANPSTACGKTTGISWSLNISLCIPGKKIAFCWHLPPSLAPELTISGGKWQQPLRVLVPSFCWYSSFSYAGFWFWRLILQL